MKIFGRGVWADPVAAKALIGVLPDGMTLPDRPTPTSQAVINVTSCGRVSAEPAVLY